MAQPKLNPQFPKEEFFFDPFGLHPQEDTSSTASPQPPPRVNRLTRSNERKPTLTPDDVSEASKPAAKSAPKTAPKSAPKTAPKSASSPTTPALPPRLVVKFMAHEEVSSVAQAQTGDEGICAVYIEGKLSAQVTSSDAMKNLPFCVVATTPEEDHVQFKPNETYSSVSSRPLPQHALALIHVPKTEIAAVPIGTYSLTEQVAHMPLVRSRPNFTFFQCSKPHISILTILYFQLLHSWWNERLPCTEIRYEWHCRCDPSYRIMAT